jgi:hypothetical protein
VAQYVRDVLKAAATRLSSDLKRSAHPCTLTLENMSRASGLARTSAHNDFPSTDGRRT